MIKYREINCKSALNKIDNEIIEKKKYIAKNLYKSQIKVLEGMSQMYPYENITKYEDWKQL